MKLNKGLMVFVALFAFFSSGCPDPSVGHLYDEIGDGEFVDYSVARGDTGTYHAIAWIEDGEIRMMMIQQKRVPLRGKRLVPGDSIEIYQNEHGYIQFHNLTSAKETVIADQVDIVSSASSGPKPCVPEVSQPSTDM